MSESTKAPVLTRALRWFNPSGRTINTIVFILNRITGLGLVLYLVLHLIMLGQLAQGPEAYDGFLAIVHSPLFLIGEVLVVAAVFIHGLNGIRIALISFGVGTRSQRTFMISLLLIAIVCSLYFAIRMFAA
jgi:succinate dehydrogenase / fumarate reductase cytochrome b subunit